MASSETDETLDQMLRDARIELSSARSAVVRWGGVVAALEVAPKASAASVLPYREATPATPVRELPIPRDAILAVMKDHPDEPMRLKRIVALLRVADLYDDTLKAGDNAYGTALRRLAHNPDFPVEPHPAGGYYYPSIPVAEQTGIMLAGNHPRPFEGQLR